MKKNSDKNNSQLIISIKLILYCFAVQTVFFVLLCIIALIGDVDSSYYYPLMILGLCIGNVFSGFINGRIKKKNGMLNGIIYALPANLVIIFASFSMNGFTLGLRLPISVALLCVFSAIGGILSVNVRKKVKIKR